jgi:hypothetical protein
MNSSSKKTQISLFFIIGITLVLVIALILVKINQDKIKELLTQTPDETTNGTNQEIVYDEKIKPVVTQVENCMKDSLIGAMKIIGDQGELEPSSYLASKNTKIAYFYFKGKNVSSKKHFQF